ncbi:MAG TPA: retropepsin-like aspartic protease [Acetobacteraceae bacterium]|nr:retropepsin-like aspartic protease [Acetobacteraceae bacterium]
MRGLTALLLLLLAGLAGCAAPESCALVPLAAMPLDTRQNLMFVTAGIGGQPVRLLVDTGAERTVLTEAAVARLGLAHDARYITRSFGIGGSSANWDADIPGIVLGQTRFPVRRVAVGDFAMDHVGGPPADGLLGADILLAFDIDIDEPAHRLTLYRVRRCPHAVPPWRQPAIRIDGLEARRDRLLVPIALDGVAGMAILDTGAQATTIGMAMARRLGLSAASLATDRTIIAHGAGPRPLAVHVHRFRELQVGNARIEAPTLAVVPNDRAVGDALLGGDFLRGRRVWLSFATRRLFVSSGGVPQIAVNRR